MTPEELLKPRRKLIAGWPGCMWAVGTIFPENFDRDWDNYPHLFKKLEWWEDREENDLPGYVKDNEGVYMVQEWHIDLAPKVTVFIDIAIHKQFMPHTTETPLYGDILPATKEQYDNYINQKA